MKGGKKKRKKELDNKTTTSINNSNRTTTDIPWFSFSIFFDQHNLVISNRCSRAGSVLHLILVLDIFDVSIIYSGSHDTGTEEQLNKIGAYQYHLCPRWCSWCSGIQDQWKAMSIWQLPLPLNFGLLDGVRFNFVGLPWWQPSWYLHPQLKRN